jgi:hypothetical protein
MSLKPNLKTITIATSAVALIATAFAATKKFLSRDKSEK